MKTDIDNNIGSNKKRLLWVILFIVIAFASVLAIIGFNKSFSLNKFITFVCSANPFWVVLAVFSMVMFILTEGMALKYLSEAFGYKHKLRDGFAYSSADIYFSAITPSATGGQPATAYFMVKDGISLPVVTVSMFCILMMYSLSILIINIICFIIKPSIILQFDILAKIIIIGGLGAQVFLIAFFYFLLFNENLLYKICSVVINLLGKLHIIKDKNATNKKLNDIINRYKDSANMLRGKNKIMMKVLGFIFLQRLAQIGVVVCVFIATNGNLGQVFDIFAIQGYVVSGSYCIPIPGAIGVSDYLMLNGFKTLMNEAAAVNLELMSRGISFYCCIILCGVTVFIKYMLQKRSSKK